MQRYLLILVGAIIFTAFIFSLAYNISNAQIINPIQDDLTTLNGFYTTINESSTIIFTPSAINFTNNQYCFEDTNICKSSL